MPVNNYITICLGSSCYARGNNRNLELIRDYIDTNNLKSAIEIKGLLCTCLCLKGPVVVINGTRLENVQPEDIISLLEKHIQ